MERRETLLAILTRSPKSPEAGLEVTNFAQLQSQTPPGTLKL